MFVCYLLIGSKSGLSASGESLEISQGLSVFCNQRHVYLISGCWLGSWAISCAQGASKKIYNRENLADMEIRTGLAGCWPRSWWLSSDKVVVLIAGFYLSLIMWTFCESCTLWAVNLLLESLLQIKSRSSRANKALHQWCLYELQPRMNTVALSDFSFFTLPKYGRPSSVSRWQCTINKQDSQHSQQSQTWKQIPAGCIVTSGWVHRSFDQIEAMASTSRWLEKHDLSDWRVRRLQQNMLFVWCAIATISQQCASLENPLKLIIFYNHLQLSAQIRYIGHFIRASSLDVEDLFKRFLLKSPDVRLWSLYLSYVRYCTSSIVYLHMC